MAPMWRKLTLGSLALALALGLLAPHALAATSNVSIVSFAFNPATVKVRLGDTVHWTNNATIGHTSTSDGFDVCCPNGASLWKSPDPMPAGTSFSFQFVAAGLFTYHCSIHTTMRGSVRVGLRVTPATGTTSTRFQVTWASATAGGVPAGFREEIQILRPGDTAFGAWKTGPAGSAGATFRPDAGAGTYKFRARLDNLSTAKDSGFSSAATIKVSA